MHYQSQLISLPASSKLSFQRLLALPPILPVGFIIPGYLQTPRFTLLVHIFMQRLIYDIEYF
jgi:uncharacterized BrkB/YihY/UPF0761 family membrane protein